MPDLHDALRGVAAMLALVVVATSTRLAVQLASRRASPLERALAHYGWDETSTAEPVAAARRIKRRSTPLSRVQARLDEADLPLRASEALSFTAGAAAVIAVVGLVATGSAVAAALLFAIVAATPPTLLKVRVDHRHRAFESQLPDLLRMLAGALRSGISFLQALQGAAGEVPEPMAGELRRAVAHARLGRSVEEALGDVATRMRSADFRFAVRAMEIQREVGGNLAQLLYRVADTMVERDRLRRDVRVLTAEGRISAVVLALLPAVVGALLYTTNREYVGRLFVEREGQLMLAGAVLLGLAGFLWIKKTTTIRL